MQGKTVLFLTTALLWLRPCFASSQLSEHASYQSSFENPPSASRPLFRYWLPDASVDGNKVAEDIVSAAGIGAGGVEFIPFFQYGGHGGRYPPGADWATYGFGSPAFVNLLEQAAEAHASRGLKMDFSLGPNQGQGVPADPSEEGLQWNLVPFAVQIPSNGSLDNPLPGWGTGKLISLVSATVESRSVEDAQGDWFPGASDTLTSFVLAEGSLRQHVNKVSSRGVVKHKFASSPKGTEQWAFAFYSSKTLIKNLKFNSSGAKHVYENGSFTVDHFSPEGAKVTIRFWEDYMLRNRNLKSIIKATGGAGWEDSPELISSITWTPMLPQRFKKRHGYDLLSYLPLIMFQSNNLAIQATSPGAFRAILNTPDGGQDIVNDYIETLELGYRQYITTLRDWLNKTLNLEFRTQVSYNLPMDMAANVPFVDIPEAESLGFHDKPDAYKQYIGPAILAGKKTVSNELGAIQGRPYSQLLSELLQSANIAFAANTNKFVLHGQPYSGNYYNTTWPGYTPFQYGFSELHSPRQPVWEHGLDEAMHYLGRAQHVMQSGHAQLDIAVYNKVSKTDPLWTKKVYSDNDLDQASFSYAYVTPANFRLPQAFVKNKVLAPDTGAFQALVLPDCSNITLQAIDDITKFAKRGLPVVIAGTPALFRTHRRGEEEQTWAAYKRLLSLPSVHSCQKGKVARTLQSVGIRPKVHVSSSQPWQHARRWDAQTGQDVIFLLGAQHPSTGNVRIASKGTPYWYNAWTGSREAVLHYTRDTGSGTIDIPLSLAGNQTAIIAVSYTSLSDVPIPRAHVIESPDGVLGFKMARNRAIEVHTTAEASYGKVKLSSGATRAIRNSNVPNAIDLREWKLTAEHWEAPLNFSDASAIASKRNSTHALTSPLVSWTALGPELTNSSGLGYYSTSFMWPPPQGSHQRPDGAYIKFEPVAHAMKLWLNGRRLPPVDPRNPIVDLSPLIRSGKNEIVAVVPTTMWNYVRTLLPKIRNAGDTPLVISTPDINLTWPTPPKTENGLTGRVHLVPYRKTIIKG